ncbi:MAG TPA: hypothetical protein PKD98_20950 [Anaerolineae bacterium]|nr:hypothetical protein [Anaerolineae bacterium]
MSSFYPSSVPTNVPNGKHPRQRRWRPAPPLPELNSGRLEDLVNNGPYEEGPYVSADSTPAENMRWMMLFQTF